MYDDEDDGNECPLCLEEMDATDLSFKPCVCGYQICVWCWNQINERFDGRCPNCRREYDTSNVQFEAMDPEAVAREAQRLKRKPRASVSGSFNTGSSSSATSVNSSSSASAIAGGSAMQRSSSLPMPSNMGSLSSSAASSGSGSSGSYLSASSASNAAGLSSTSSASMVGSGATNPALLSAAMRRDLSNVRVIQRNLVYVVGLPPSIAREELLKQHEYFAQYGRILKIVVNKPHSTQHPRNSHSAYVTYADAGAARTAIECVDGVIVDDRVVKASFGTTKYCSYFLRGISCSNPECMYLHELGDEQDTFTKEDMILRKAAFQNSIHPPSHPENDLWAGPGFPPPNRDEINDGYYSEEDAATREEPAVQATAGASTVTTMSQAVAQGPGPSPGAAGPVAEVEWPSIQSAATAKAAAGKAAPPRAYSAIATGGTAAAVLAGNAKQASSKGPVSAAAVVAGAVAAPASTSSPVPGSTATAATSATSGASMTSATAGSSAPTAASFKADAVSANGTAGTHAPHVGHGAVVEDKGPVCTFLRHVVPLPRAALQWAAMNTMAWSITSSATWNASQWADLHTKSIAELLPDVLGDMTPKAPLRT